MQFYISTNDEYLDRTVKAIADGAGCPAVISRFDGERGDDVCAVISDAASRPDAEYVIVISKSAAAEDEKTRHVSRPVDLEALRDVILEVSRRGKAPCRHRSCGRERPDASQKVKSQSYCRSERQSFSICSTVQTAPSSRETR